MNFVHANGVGLAVVQAPCRARSLKVSRLVPPCPVLNSTAADNKSRWRHERRAEREPVGVDSFLRAEGGERQGTSSKRWLLGKWDSHALRISAVAW